MFAREVGWSEGVVFRGGPVIFQAVEAKLATGGVDVGPFAFSNRDGNSSAFEDADELSSLWFLWGRHDQFADAVHRNQVNVSGSAGKQGG